jgi:hypothetical protein
MLALTLGAANGLVANGIPAHRPSMPAISMNAEAAAKAAWLAKQEQDWPLCWVSRADGGGDSVR